MICKFCATGADMVSRAREIRTDNGDFSFGVDLTGMGEKLHTFCKGCDCQHKRMSEANVAQG